MHIQSIFRYSLAMVSFTLLMSPSTYSQDAEKQKRDKELKADIQLFTAVLALNKQDHDTFHLRGIAHFLLHEHDLAIQDFSEAIRLAPSISKYWNERGSAHWENKKYELAMTDFNKAIELNPNFIGSYIERSRIWNIKKDYSKQIQDLDKAEQLGYKEYDLYYKSCIDTAVRELSSK